MNKKIYSYLILGIYFTCGLALGFILTKKPLLCRNSVTVNIVKEGDEILIYERFSGNLVFEYSKTNPTDSSAYREFDDLREEITSQHH
jgi:glycine betaine/choline ABC-type transport system substrate-binding protein